MNATPADRFKESELDAFLECGILTHGFLRLRCADCAHEKLVAFSCKRRGFCPTCGARRMAEAAAHLVDHVIPRVAVRQWVLSFPIPLRFLLAAHPQLLSPVLQAHCLTKNPTTQRSLPHLKSREQGVGVDEKTLMVKPRCMV